MHSKAETIVAIARQHDVLLFDFSIGPEALERTLSALRTSPLGASIAILVPQQTALPPAVSSLANACVIETASGDVLVAALRDAAWTPWQPIDGQDEADAPRADVFWKAFDALPVPVLVVDDAGTILHANGACTKLADGAELLSKPLASFFVAADGPAIARLIADGFAGGYEDTPVFTAPADGQTVQVVLQALSVLPGASRAAAAGDALRAARRGGRARAAGSGRPRPRRRVRGADGGARRAGADRRRLARRADAPARGARGAARTRQRRPPRAGRTARPARDRAARPRPRARAGADRSGEDPRARARHRRGGADGSRRGTGAGPAGREHRGAVDAAQRARRAAAAHDHARAPRPSAPRCATRPSKRPRARRSRS